MADRSAPTPPPLPKLPVTPRKVRNIRSAQRSRQRQKERDARRDAVAADLINAVIRMYSTPGLYPPDLEVAYRHAISLRVFLPGQAQAAANHLIPPPSTTSTAFEDLPPLITPDMSDALHK